MSDEIITKHGVYGRLQVTLPMPIKLSVLNWSKKTGMGRAEFLREALIYGAVHLVGQELSKGRTTKQSDLKLNANSKPQSIE